MCHVSTSKSGADVSSAALLFMFLQDNVCQKDSMVRSAASIQVDDFLLRRKWCSWNGKWHHRISLLCACEQMMTQMNVACLYFVALLAQWVRRVSLNVSFVFVLLFQVYIIKVSWSDGSTEVIYRRYSKFFDLQVSEGVPVCVSVCWCVQLVWGVKECDELQLFHQRRRARVR